MAADEVVVHAVGDVFVNRPDPTEPFSHVAGVLDAADVVFGNCEVPFSRSGAETRDTSFTADATSAAGLRSAGFTVMSCANNHVCDAGAEGLAVTLDVLHALGIATAGAGADLDDARQPAVLAVGGRPAVALLAYACYFRRDDVASADRPGIVAVGGETLGLDGPRGICSPGVAPMVTSVPAPADVDAMVRDIEQARRRADVVVASFHWGDATRPSVLTDHEQRTAHAAIDAGADAVVGHHHHVLRGIELYRGKPVFYGLGNFVWDAPVGWAEAFSPGTRDRMRRLGKYALRPRPGYPRLPFHADGRMTMIARCRFRGRELRWCGFVPCLIGPDGCVAPLPVGTDAGRRVVEFVQDNCDDLELPVTLRPDPGERVGGFAAVRASRGET